MTAGGEMKDVIEAMWAAYADARLHRKEPADAMRAALSAALERGYRLVPVEPTDEMVARGGDGIDGHVDYDKDDLTISEEDALAAYRAMIAASPEVK